LYFVSRGDGSHEFSGNLRTAQSRCHQYQLKGRPKPEASAKTVATGGRRVPRAERGLFITLEGGEGAGKSTSRIRARFPEQAAARRCVARAAARRWAKEFVNRCCMAERACRLDAELLLMFARVPNTWRV
jgi:hypothetical protein